MLGSAFVYYVLMIIIIIINLTNGLWQFVKIIYTINVFEWSYLIILLALIVLIYFLIRTRIDPDLVGALMKL